MSADGLDLQGIALDYAQALAEANKSRNGLGALVLSLAAMLHKQFGHVGPAAECNGTPCKSTRLLAECASVPIRATGTEAINPPKETA